MYGIAIECIGSTDGEGRKKLVETVEWHDIYAEQCEACREMYGNRKPPEKPPCSTCKPERIEENEQAVKIFYLTRNQLIMGQKGPIDIMHGPIYKAMDLYDVVGQKGCFEKVLTMSRIWLNNMREK